MPQPYELKHLFDEGRYDQVISFWQDPNEVAQFTNWDFKADMDSFYKLKRYQDCLEVYRVCHKKFSGFNRLNDKMGWAIYHTKVKNFDFKHGDMKALLRQIDYAIVHSSDTQYSARWLLAKFVAKATEDGKLGNERNYQLAVHYLDMVNPDTLSTEEIVQYEENGKVRQMASERESWYSYETKLLLQMQDYEACITCCGQALDALHGVRLHSNNDSWFRYRKAKCLRALNRTKEAQNYVEEILKSGFRDWRMLNLMFEFEAEAGNDEKALDYAGECALSDHDHGMQINFYEKLADYLERSGETETPLLLRKLVLLIREKNEWSEKHRHTEWKFSEEIDTMDERTVLKQLIPIWREWRDKDKVFLTGTIERLLPEGKSGFIVAEDGKNYYFNARDLQGKKHTPEIGMHVKFILVDKLDKSKGQVKKSAAEITVL